MKILLIIKLLFVLFLESLFGQTKAEIIKFNIVKVDTETKNGNWEMISSTYYDRNGNAVMNIVSNSNFKFIIYNEYSDTLLVKQIEVKYKNGKLVDSLVNKFLYKFDNDGLIIENKLITANGEVKINTIKTL